MSLEMQLTPPFQMLEHNEKGLKSRLEEAKALQMSIPSQRNCDYATWGHPHIRTELGLCMNPNLQELCSGEMSDLSAWGLSSQNCLELLGWPG